MILNDLPNIGPISLNRLLEAFGGDPLQIFAATKRQLESVRGIGPESSAALLNWREHFDLAREEERLAKAGAAFITARDEGYPPLLKEIHDPPIGLYRKGGYLFDKPGIAVIGSRRTTLYGQSIAKKLGADLARLGFCVVSGLARGIDTAAHEGALSVGGKTAAVLGNGQVVVIVELLELLADEPRGALMLPVPGARSTCTSRSRCPCRCISSARWWQSGLFPARPNRLNAVQVHPARHSSA